MKIYICYIYMIIAFIYFIAEAQYFYLRPHILLKTPSFLLETDLFYRNPNIFIENTIFSLETPNVKGTIKNWLLQLYTYKATHIHQLNNFNYFIYLIGVAVLGWLLTHFYKYLWLKIHKIQPKNKIMSDLKVRLFYFLFH